MLSQKKEVATSNTTSYVLNAEDIEDKTNNCCSYLGADPKFLRGGLLKT